MPRCNTCNGCLNHADGYSCFSCKYCLDHPKRGGDNKFRKACTFRWCSVMNPRPDVERRGGGGGGGGKERLRVSPPRCKACDGCLNLSKGYTCDRCEFCLDSPRLGGPNRKRQVCKYKWCVLMTQAREDFERRKGLTRQTDPLGEGPNDKEPLDKKIEERGVKRRREEMVSPGPGKMSIEVKQEKKERLKDMEDRTALVLGAWKSMEGSGIDSGGVEGSLLSTFFGDKIERLKEDLSHMIQLELEEMEVIKSKDVSIKKTTEYYSREEDEELAGLEKNDAMVDIEEAEIILPNIIGEEHIHSVPKEPWY